MKIAVALAAALAMAGMSATACKSAESKGAPTPEAAASDPKVAPAPAPAAPAAKGAAATTGDDSSFNLQVAAPTGAKAGAPCVAHVTVTPGSGYHVNQDFPTKLVITPPDGVKVAKAEMHKEDAAAFDANKLQFDVALTPDKPGTYKVAGTLKFAVCTESSCDPKKREIAIDVAAQ
jgi:hypothetical protein